MSKQLRLSTASNESYLILKSIKSKLKITCYNLIVFCILIQSNSLLAAPINKIPPPKIDIKEYLHIERVNNSIKLQWVDYNVLPKSYIDDYLSQYEYKIKGYLITLYEKIDEESSNNLKSLINEVGYSSKVYYTNSKCLEINNVSNTLESIIDLSYILEVTDKSNKNLIIIRITKTSPNFEREGLRVPMETTAKNFNLDHTCKYKVIEKVTLKKLYHNKDFYINKLIEVSGDVESDKNKLKRIASCVSRGDGEIYSDKYSLCIPGIYNFYMTFRIKKIKVKKISIIGYLTKYEYQTKQGVTETRYSFSSIDISNIK